MPPSTETMRRYLIEMQDVELPNETIDRLAAACATAGEAVAGVASESLFDTEPEQLHTVLEELAGNSDT